MKESDWNGADAVGFANQAPDFHQGRFAASEDTLDFVAALLISAVPCSN